MKSCIALGVCGLSLAVVSAGFLPVVIGLPAPPKPQPLTGSADIGKASGEISPPGRPIIRPHSVQLGGGRGDNRWTSFEDMHARYTRAFAEADRFGIARMDILNQPKYLPIAVDGVPHYVTEIQLTGLLDREPVVYDSPWSGLSVHLLSEYRQRPPDGGEAAALKLLRNGEPWVWMSPTEGAGPHGGMLTGPLRADSSCLDCHDARMGEILGALSYRLKPPASLYQSSQNPRYVAAKLSAQDNHRWQGSLWSLSASGR